MNAIPAIAHEIEHMQLGGGHPEQGDAQDFLRTAAGYLQVIAHEVGHVLVGKGHPGEYNAPKAGPAQYGIAPLPGTNVSRRLMTAGSLFDCSNPGILLVKKEWDAADAWLVSRGK